MSFFKSFKRKSGEKLFYAAQNGEVEEVERLINKGVKWDDYKYVRPTFT